MAKNNGDKGKKAAKERGPAPRTEETSQPAGIFQDERFQHLVSDPRFRSLPHTQRKVQIDKRFQGMFTDDKFRVKYTVDKYGRRVNKSNAEDLKKYYEIESSSGSENEQDEDEDEEAEEVQKDESTDAQPAVEHEENDEAEQEEKERRKEEQAISRATDDSGESSASDVEPGENDELVASEDEDDDEPKTLRERLLDPTLDYARGEGRLVTDSSSDDDSSDEEDPELFVDHVWGELDVDAATTDESTRRLAVCNMDWDRIRAADLMVLFSSFLPPGGSVLSVTIYPSQFGKERMAEEEKHGPQELVGLGKEQKKVKTAKDSDSEEDIVQEQDSDAEEGDDYHMEKLRQYQLNRLRYYYAVVECDSVPTAEKIYQECDGIEYESSATRVDLRYIPDDTSFDEDEPEDVCTELPESSSYKPRQFTTTALQQAKVDLTWDETAVERRELGDKLSSGKLEDVSDKDLRKIVAYSSEEDDDGGDDNDEDQAEPEEEIKEEVSPDEARTDKGKKKKSKDTMISKYKALLAEINEKESQQKNKKYEMEFSWNVNQAKEDNDAKDLDVNAKAKQQQQQQLTPIEKEMQKRNEKNKKRKEERKKKKKQALGLDVDDAANSDSDSDESVPDGIDMNDPYFAEEFANGDFVEPKKSKPQQKGKRNKQTAADDDEEEEQRAKELQLLLDDDDVEEQGKQHFSLEKIQKSEQETKSKKKRRAQLRKSKSTVADARKEVEDNFQLNVDDDRFKAVYSSHLYNIDPTDSHFKKTKGMEQIINEKLKRRHGKAATQPADEQAVAAKRPKKQLENTMLVKSLKRKIELKQQQR